MDRRESELYNIINNGIDIVNEDIIEYALDKYMTDLLTYNKIKFSIEFLDLTKFYHTVFNYIITNTIHLRFMLASKTEDIRLKLNSIVSIIIKYFIEDYITETFTIPNDVYIHDRNHILTVDNFKDIDNDPYLSIHNIMMLKKKEFVTEVIDYILSRELNYGFYPHNRDKLFFNSVEELYVLLTNSMDNEECYEYIMDMKLRFKSFIDGLKRFDAIITLPLSWLEIDRSVKLRIGRFVGYN